MRMFVRIFLVLIKESNIHWSFGNLEQKHMLSSGCFALDSSVTLCVGKVFLSQQFPLLFLSLSFYTVFRGEGMREIEVWL